ncbi:MAG: cytochrome c3 family protein [Bryobacteraceae bacterium]
MRWAAPSILILTLVAQAPEAPTLKYQPKPPEQPIPYSHRAHLKLGLECKTCHTMPDPGDFATLPKTAVCMSCHDSVKKDSPHIQKLAETHAAGGEIVWRRIYRIPEYVFFSHKEHVKAGATCAACHGPVAERDVIRKEKDHSMAGCMECHRAAQASLACNYCHEPK